MAGAATPLVARRCLGVPFLPPLDVSVFTFISGRSSFNKIILKERTSRRIAGILPLNPTKLLVRSMDQELSAVAAQPINYRSTLRENAMVK